MTTYLNNLNDSGFTRAHIQAILVAGSGFLTDSYDNFIIGLIIPMLAYSYFGMLKLDSFSDGWLKAASSYGNVVGQLLFAVLVDIFGRKKIYGIELIILIIGAIGSAVLSFPINNISIIVILIFWRFILGVGVGGDYSVSAVITSEFASSKYRGTMIAIVFAMQGVGIIIGSLMSTIVLTIFKEAIIEDPVKNLNYCWRILAGFGIVPAGFAVYFRLTIPETSRYIKDVLEDSEDASKATENFLNRNNISRDHSREINRKQIFNKYIKKFSKHFSKWSNLKVLLGCALCWFFVDIGYYGTSLNTSVILRYIGYGTTNSTGNQKIYDNLWNISVGTTLINLCSTVPGYWFTVAFVDNWGRKPIQYLGFIMLTLVFFFMALFYKELSTNQNIWFVILYSIAQFFFNFGPNTTTFILPAESFPTRVRATAHGISAASGKIGAILAAQGFSLIAHDGSGIQTVLYIFSGCCLIGLYFTTWVNETKGKSLEEICPPTPYINPNPDPEYNISDINEIELSTRSDQEITKSG